MKPHRETPFINLLLAIFFGVASTAFCVWALGFSIVEINRDIAFDHFHMGKTLEEVTKVNRRVGTVEAISYGGLLILTVISFFRGVSVYAYFRRPLAEGWFSVFRLYWSQLLFFFARSALVPVAVWFTFWRVREIGKSGFLTEAAHQFFFFGVLFVASSAGGIIARVIGELRFRTNASRVVPQSQTEVVRGTPLANRDEAIARARDLFEDRG